jgi:O-antigen ligase
MKTHRKGKSANKSPIYLILGGVVITLIITPWFSKDSYAIPKQLTLLIVAMYFLPSTLTYIKKIFQVKFGKLILLLVGLTYLQLTLIVLLSGAPLDQQIYGKDGRLLGFLTFFSLGIIFMSAIQYFNFANLKIISKAITTTLFLVSIYAITQSFGFDVFDWESRTNKVISFIGNPNYVSAFVAFALVPSLVYFNEFKFKKVVQFSSLFLCLFTIYRSESIQGYIAIFIALGTYLLITIYYHFKNFFYSYVIISSVFLIFIIFGTLGHGPLAPILYKISVQSRGDFWRSALATANDNPIFGVGLDSFGDNYLAYRDSVAASHDFAEFTDSAHNFLLDYAAWGGYLLAVFNFGLIVLTIYLFLRLQSQMGFVSPFILGIFVAWLALQSTFLISPLSLPMLYWSNLISGALIGLSLRLLNPKHDLDMINNNATNKFRNPVSLILALIAILLMVPLFRVDNMYLQSLNRSDGNLGIKAVTTFPQSTMKFAMVGRLLFQSGEYKYSLDVARAFVKFNPLTPTSHALIMVNPLATYEERVKAKTYILERDPFNKDVMNYEINLESK